MRVRLDWGSDIILQKVERTFLESLLRVAAEGIVVHGADGRIVLCNASATAMLGLSEEHLIGRTSYDVDCVTVHEDGSPFPAHDHPAAVTLRSGEPCHGVVMGIRHGAHRPRWISVNTARLAGGDGTVQHVFAVFTDITARIEATRRLRETLEQLRTSNDSMRQVEKQLRTIITMIPDLLWLKDLNGVYRECNPAFERFFGATRMQIVGKTDRDFIDFELADAFRERDLAALHSNLDVVEETLTYAGDGRRAWVETIRTPLRDAAGAPIGILGVARDVTYRHALEDQLRLTVTELETLNERFQELARTDPLTALANRRALTEAMQNELARIKRHGTASALLMIDIDRFKHVNDTHGHEAGDRALTALASVLKSIARATDLPARFGGEEFVVLLTHTRVPGAQLMAERIRSTIAGLPIASPLGAFNFSVSIGVAPMLSGDRDWSAAVSRADAAMYRAKAAGCNRVEVASLQQALMC